MNDLRRIIEIIIYLITLTNLDFVGIFDENPFKNEYIMINSFGVSGQIIIKQFKKKYCEKWFIYQQRFLFVVKVKTKQSINMTEQRPLTSLLSRRGNSKSQMMSSSAVLQSPQTVCSTDRKSEDNCFRSTNSQADFQYSRRGME